MNVQEVIDLKNGWSGLPPTDGIMLQLEGGRVIARPSGTEPKLKCYLECVIQDVTDVAAAEKHANDIIAQMKSDMALALGV
jgi:phosphomannomutase